MQFNTVILFLCSPLAATAIYYNHTVASNLLAHIIESDFRNCLVTFIQSDQGPSDFSFLERLPQSQIPYSIVNLAVVVNFTMSRKIPLKFITNECDLVIIRHSSPKILLIQLPFITKLVYPKRLHQTRVIFMQWEDNNNNSSSALNHKNLTDIPFKLIIKSVKSNSGHDRALLLGLCDFCIDHKTSSRNLSRSSTSEFQQIIVGGYDDIHGYRRYTRLFPEVTSLRKTNISAVFPLEFFKRHAFVRPKLAFTELFRVLFEVVKSLDLVLDYYKGASVDSEPISLNYTRDVDAALKKNRMSVAIIYFFHEPNILRLQTSTYYTYHRSTVIYRKMKQDSRNLLRQNFKKPVEQYLFPIALGATIIMYLSTRWDLVTVSRLPKPINGDKWKRRCRKLRFSTITNLLWEVAHTMSQQKEFPKLSFNKFTLSATLTLILVTLFTIFVNWLMRMAPLADMVKPVPKFQLRSTDDILHLIEDSSKILDRSVRIISAISRDDLQELFATSYKGSKAFVEKVLNETDFNVNPSVCLEKAKAESTREFVVCIGILNILARAMISHNSADAHILDIREVGSMKFCSYAFSQEFPYPHLFSRKIARLVQSGIPDHWVQEAVRVTLLESRRNASKLQVKPIDYENVQAGQDPISFQLMDTTFHMFTEDTFGTFIVLCVELLVGYRSKIMNRIQRIFLCFMNLLGSLSRKIRNFMWESNQE